MFEMVTNFGADGTDLHEGEKDDIVLGCTKNSETCSASEHKSRDVQLRLSY
jgi:hypothetical protein